MLRSHTLLHLLDLRLPTPETDISIPVSSEPLPLKRRPSPPASTECLPFVLSATTAGASPTASSALLLPALVAASGGSSKQAKEHAKALPTIDPSHEWRGGSREPLLGSRNAIHSHERRKLGFRSTCASPPPLLALGSAASLRGCGGGEGPFTELEPPFLLHRIPLLGKMDLSHDRGPFRSPPRPPLAEPN